MLTKGSWLRSGTLFLLVENTQFFAIMHDMKDEENNKSVDEEILEALHVDIPEQDISYEETTEDGDKLPTKDVVKKLRDELKKVRAEKEEYLTGWQRAKADYVNLQKSEQEKYKELKTHVTTSMIEDLLPVLDSFDMAMGNKEAWEKVDANWRKGIEHIHQQFLRVLVDNNVTAINQSGVAFDPNMHESISIIETSDESQDHTVYSVTQSGYKIGDRVIRPARVNVFEFKK
jgi:molecular chaperone GrpE